MANVLILSLTNHISLFPKLALEAGPWTLVVDYGSLQHKPEPEHKSEGNTTLHLQSKRKGCCHNDESGSESKASSFLGKQ
jgi:hypothetical protein